MPIIKSAKKALRQAEKRRTGNLARKRAINEVIRKIKKFLSEGKQNDALALLPRAYQALDKAAKTNVIHKNAASRKKSRLTKIVNKSAKT